MLCLLFLSNYMFTLNKKIVLIYGPTASGKTDFAEKIAQAIPSEIINMDSAQMYVPLTIGTAKPDWKQSPIPQHLFDIVDEPRHISVHTYRLQAITTMHAIWTRNHLPIFVGGSGFYLKSLLFPPEAASISKRRLSIQGIPDHLLWQRLHDIDPIRAAEIHPHDLYRIKRALEIWQKTGKRPSIYKPVYDPPASFVLVYVTRNRKNLYDRINKRVIQMVQADWLNEVTNLIGTQWEFFVQEKGFIGYAELIDYLKHGVDLTETIKHIQQRTRNYAKRQETFWRMLKAEINKAQQKPHRFAGKILEFDLTFSNYHLYIKQLLDEIHNEMVGNDESD